MDQSKLNKLQDLIANGYDFRFGDYIDSGYQLFKKDMGSFVGFTAVFLLIAGFSNVIPLVGSFAFSLLLAPPLTVGYYLVAHKLNIGERTEFGNFFKGFDYLGQLVLVALTSMVVSLICFAPFIGSFFSLMTGDLEAMENFRFSSWMFLCMIPVIYLSVAWMWASLFIVFYKMPFWDAMEMSRQVITKNWLSFFLFVIVLSLIAALGMIAFCIGLLFTMPIFYCAMYAAFADVTGLLDDEEGVGIEDHLVD